MEQKAITTLAYTALASAVFTVGLFLFAADMRTLNTPVEHVFIADASTALLAVITVCAGIPAIAHTIGQHRTN